LSSAIKQQTQNQAAAQQVRLQQEHVNLAEEKQQFDEGQLPWATVGGVLSAGVQLAGGWDALRNANEAKVRAAQNEAIQQETLRQQQAANAGLLATFGKMGETYNTMARPKPAVFDWNQAQRFMGAPY